MKKHLLFFIMLALLASSCNNFIVVKRDPTVLDSTIMLSGCVSGQAWPSVRTASMHLTGQAQNFILLEAYGTETCTGTESVSIKDSLSNNSIFLEVIDKGPFTYSYCHRNLQFWVGPFESDAMYTIHFIESKHSYFRDTLTHTFTYSQNIDTSITADTSVSMLSNTPLGTCNISFSDCEQVSDSLYTLLGSGVDSLTIFESNNTMNIELILYRHCCLLYDPVVSVSGDSLIMNLQVDASNPCDCMCYYLFNYFFDGYEGQGFHYRTILGNNNAIEGNYNLP